MINASICPISRSEPVGAVGGPGNPHTVLKNPSIPPIVDLPSLIGATNIMRQILINIVNGLVVNNEWRPGPRIAKAQGDKYYTHYPAWDQVGIDLVNGFVFHHSRGQPIDTSSRAFVQRINRVIYRNTEYNEQTRQPQDPDFYWAYSLPPDQTLKTFLLGG